MDPVIQIDANLVQTIIDIAKSIPSQGGEWLVNELTNNQFLVATLIPALLWAFWQTFRGTIYGIVGYFKMLITSEVTFNSDNECYHEMTQFLYDKSVSSLFQRFFTVSYSWHSEHLILTIGYGTSIGFIGWCPMIISRVIEDSQSAKFKETVKIKIIGGRKNTIMKLMEKFNLVADRAGVADVVNIYKIDKDGDVMRLGSKPHRMLDTVIIPDVDKDYILGKMDHFMKSEQYYLKKGLPYHLGIILSGPPGTGKTSLIHALASHYNRDVCFCDGSTIRTGGLNMEKTVLVIEDIDVSGMAVNRRAETTTSETQTDDAIRALAGESMSNLLNFLDGLISPHGLITIVTTNHYDSLDPALVRPGRFDVHLEFKNMEWPEWVRLCELLDRVNPVLETEYSIISPAQARYMLLYYSDDDIRKFFANPVVINDATPSVIESAEPGDHIHHSPKRGRRH